MKIWRVPYKLQILESHGRSTGIHLSDIVRDLALRGRQLDPKYANKDTMRAERIELGIAWEERIPKHHPEICFHPGEISVDGIAMSIDGASQVGNEPSLFHPTGCDLRTPDNQKLDTWVHALHEFKLTWKSSNLDLTRDFMWMAQGAGYLHGLSKEYGVKVRTSFWHVFWVNGNYRRDDTDPESGPTYCVYGIQLSDLEVKEYWDMMRNHRDRMEKPGQPYKISSIRGNNGK